MLDFHFSILPCLEYCMTRRGWYHTTTWERSIFSRFLDPQQSSGLLALGCHVPKAGGKRITNQFEQAAVSGTSDHIVNTGLHCCPSVQVKCTAWRPWQSWDSTMQQVLCFLCMYLWEFSEKVTHTNLKKTSRTKLNEILLFLASKTDIQIYFLLSYLTFLDWFSLTLFVQVCLPTACKENPRKWTKHHS